MQVQGKIKIRNNESLELLKFQENDFNVPGEFFILRQSYNSKTVHYMKKSLMKNFIFRIYYLKPFSRNFKICSNKFKKYNTKNNIILCKK